MIVVDNVSKRFSTTPFNPFRKPEITTALDGVSITVEKGGIVALVGRNGAGKSTLLKILSTVVIPDSGNASVSGCDVVRQAADVKKHIGFAGGDERSFYWRLTGRQNLILFATLQNIPRAEIGPRVDSALRIFGLAHRAETPFRNYSTGMRQRLSLARSILHDPHVLLLDEPGKGLDPLLHDNFKRFLKEKLSAERGMTILFATHDLDMAIGLAHKVALLDRGKILFFGEPENAEHIRRLMQEYAAGDDFAFGGF